MEQRVSIEKTQPEVWTAMYGLSAVVSKSALTPIQKHLIMLRTSQINSCAFCINMHTKEALKLGETQQRLFLISAWRETSIFTDEEKAILALTEEVTLIHQNGVSENTYKEALKYFDSAMNESADHQFLLERNFLKNGKPEYDQLLKN